MKQRNLKYLALALMLQLAAISGTARAEAEMMGSKMAVSGAIDVGVQQKDVDGSDEKFSEYRDVENGFAINDLALKLDGQDSPGYLELKIRDPLQDDESYRLEAGRHGKVKFSLIFDALTHNFSNGTFLWGGFGTNRLQISDVVQGQLEANEQTGAERSGGVLNLATDPNLDTTGEDAIQQGIVKGLYAAADTVTFKIKREKTGASLEYNLNDDAKLWVRMMNENRDGARVISAGTYERWNVGSGLTHTIDRFLASGAELAEPIDYQTLTLTAGAGIYKKNWLADIEYSFTDFSNENEALLWDNPFRSTDAIQAGGVNRGRFEVGQLALTPDSQSHDLTVSGAADLPLHGKLAGSLSYGLITQDEDFVPYTYNSAILATNVTGTPSAATLALPQDNLNGEVQTLAGTLSLNLRPVNPLTVNAKYRYYDYDGKSDEILFPGYAAFGESAWRTVKNDKNAPVENEVFDYTRQDIDLGADFRVAKPLTLSVEAGWEGWDFEELRLDGMDEYSVGAGFNYKPIAMAILKGGYKYSDRTIDGYLKGRTEENPEATGLINYNWSDRQRQQADARLQVTPSELLAFGLSGTWVDEEYGGDTEGDTVVDTFRFGRTDVESITGALDATVTPSERISFNASYTKEYRKEQMANAAKDDSAKATPFLGIADDYSPVNYWNSDITEKADTVGVSTTIQLIPEKLTFDAGYTYSLSRMDIQTFNPNAIDATTLANAVAQDWGTVRSRLQEVNADLGYKITDNIKAGLRYLYERYDLDDFSTDNMQNYLAGTTVENTTKFVFANATYSGYEAHAGGVYLTCKF